MFRLWCQILGARLLAPSLWCFVPGAPFLAPGSRVSPLRQIFGDRFLVPGFWRQVFGGRSVVLHLWCQICGARFLMLCLWRQINVARFLDFRRHVSGARLVVFRMRCQISGARSLTPPSISLHFFNYSFRLLHIPPSQLRTHPTYERNHCSKYVRNKKNFLKKGEDNSYVTVLFGPHCFLLFFFHMHCFRFGLVLGSFLHFLVFVVSSAGGTLGITRSKNLLAITVSYEAVGRNKPRRTSG